MKLHISILYKVCLNKKLLFFTSNSLRNISKSKIDKNMFNIIHFIGKYTKRQQVVSHLLATRIYRLEYLYKLYYTKYWLVLQKNVPFLTNLVNISVKISRQNNIFFVFKYVIQQISKFIYSLQH